MQIDSLVLLKAFFTPLFFKILLIALLVGIFFRILNILVDRKLKKIKPIKIESSKLIVLAILIIIGILLLLKFL